MGILFHHSKRVILILVGIAALAGGPAAVVASAAPNDGGLGYDCGAGKTWFDQRVKDYNDLKGSNPRAAADAKKDAQAEKDRATKAGCKTSDWIVPFLTTSSNPYSAGSGGSSTLQILGGGGTTVGPITARATSGSTLTP